MSVGPQPKPVDPMVVQEAIRAEADEKARAKYSRAGSGSGALVGVGVTFAAAAVLIIGGLFLVRFLETSAKPTVDWRPTQLAVAQLVGESGTGSGFLFEENNELWLATNYHVLEGESKVDALFRDPGSGDTVVPLRAIPTAEFLVHPRFLEVNETSEDRRTFDFAVCKVEVFRPLLENAEIHPLQLIAAQSVAQGERVFALGHPGSDAFNLAKEGDAAAAGVSTHSMFEGIVSRVHPTKDKPTLVQTTALFAGGCSGGPLVLEAGHGVVGVNTWRSVGEGKEAIRFSLAADQLLDVVHGATPLASVKAQIAQGARQMVPAVGTVAEIGEWKTFPALDAFMKNLVQDGWQVRAQLVGVTDRSGSLVYQHVVQTQPRANVAVVALPRERSIDLDINEITAPSFRGLGESLQAAHGDFAAVGIGLPDSDDLASVAAGVSLRIPLSTWFLGEPIAARVVLLVLERSVSEEGVPGGTPPPRPPAPPQQGTPVGPASAKSLCNEEVYASSILGMSQFDQKWLGLQEQGAAPLQALREQLVPPLSESELAALPDTPLTLRSIREASLDKALQKFAATRPVLNMAVSGVEPEAKVGVYMTVGAHGSLSLMPVDKEVLVSKSDSTVLEAGQVPLEFPWDMDALRRMTQSIDLPLQFRVRLSDQSEMLVRQTMRVWPPCDVERTYPCGLAWATLVEPQHPYVVRLINEINQRPSLKQQGIVLSGAGSAELSEQLQSMYLVWKELSDRGIRYQNMPQANSSNAQRARPVHEALCTGNANCVDGSVMLASFLDAMGFDVAVVLVPTHALVAVELTGRLVGIEATAMNFGLLRDPPTRLDAEFKQISSSDPLFDGAPFFDFEAALESGTQRLIDEIKAAKQMLAKAGRGEHLANQVVFVWPREARYLGVRALGAPSDLEKRFPLPK